MDNVTLAILAAVVLLSGVALAVWCERRYEIAIFMVALSPWISALFFPASANIDIDAEPEPALGSYIRIGLLLLTGAAGLFRFLKARSTGPVRLPVEFVLLGGFLIFALLSTSYSIDPRYTFIRSASFIALFGFLLGLYSWLENERRLNQTLYTLFYMVSLVTLISVLTLAASPGRAWYGSRFQGLWDHPNGMGGFCMLAYPLLFWVYPRCTPFKKCMVAALLLTLICLHLLTGSRGSLLAAVCGVCMWFVVQRKPARVILLVSAITVGGFVLMQLLPASFERAEGYSATNLSERPEFWYGGLTLISERPILGYGYAVEGGVWNDPRFNRPEYALWRGTARTSLHNGYLSVAIGLGLAALLVWCGILFMPLWRVRILPYSDYKALAMAVMVSSLVLNGVETEIGGMAVIFWIAWVIAGKVSQAHSSPLVAETRAA